MMTAIENDADDDVIIVVIELVSWPVGEPPSISLDHVGPRILQGLASASKLPGEISKYHPNVKRMILQFLHLCF